MTTPKTGAPELVESQADKEETANEAFRRIEAGASFYLVADKDLSSPPGSCADGAQYIVAATGSGAWAARTGEVAIAVGVDASNGWYFREPEEGVFAWVQDENLLYYRSAGDSPGTWAAYSASPGPITLDQLSDVDVSSSPTAVGGQVLTFNGSIWVPGTPAAGGATTLDGLTDVDTSSSPGPANGDVLTYNSALALWIPGTPRIQWDPSIQSVTSSATVTPTFSDDQVNITAQAAGLTLANPTGTAVPAWGLVVRIKDNGTARAISYDTQYRAIGVTLPTTTVVSKTLYLGMIYNSTDTMWDVVAVAQEA